ARIPLPIRVAGNGDRIPGSVLDRATGIRVVPSSTAKREEGTAGEQSGDDASNHGNEGNADEQVRPVPSDPIHCYDSTDQSSLEVSCKSFRCRRVTEFACTFPGNTSVGPAILRH